MRQQLPHNLFCMKLEKYGKYNILLTFDGLSKNLKNALLNYNAACLCLWNWSDKKKITK